MTMKSDCLACGGTGNRIVHRQGDPVPGYPQNEWTRTTYASTLYVLCECRIIQLPGMPILPMPELP